MAGLVRREPHGEAADVFSRFDRLFEEWARMMPFRPMSFPRWLEAGDLIRVEEYREDGTLVVRADLPGIDPDKDVELTVAGGMLHIEAERRAEEKREEKGYLRREVRYGAVSSTAPRAARRPDGQSLERCRLEYRQRWRPKRPSLCRELSRRSVRRINPLRRPGMPLTRSVILGTRLRGRCGTGSPGHPGWRSITVPPAG